MYKLLLKPAADRRVRHMKKLMLTSVVLAVAVSPALAFDWLGVFEDQAGFDIAITDVVAGSKSVYIVHHSDAGATFSEFLVNANQTTFTYVSTEIGVGFLSLGEANTGIMIAYPNCLLGTFVACKVNYDALGTTAPCALITMDEDPNAVPPARIYVDCLGNARSFLGGQLVVNPDLSCDPNATQPATWGSIKALYH
jgi:hypothetical protein